MPIMTLCAFIFLGASFLSLWFKREPKIWGTLACLAIVSGMVAGHITWVGLVFMMCLALLWIFYDKKPSMILFIALVLLGLSFKLQFLPGYHPFFITSKFALGLEKPLIGLFPLALLVPLARKFSDWKGVIKGLGFGFAGIAVLALLATLSGQVHWNIGTLKLPSYAGVRILSNLFLTCIPEEGFFRGFIQYTLCKYFKNMRAGNVLALIITALVFSVTHIYWSPNLGILVFTFLAGLLYGSVYLFSGKIESAMICHLALNLIHMMFFSYHAM